MDVIVVGAGIVGLSTAWALTKRGHAVTLLEQAETIPSPLAASGDRHRMIRRAYGARSGYGRLIDEAFDAWDELWSDLGASHYVEAGVMGLCQSEGDEADVFRQGFDAAGTSYERMNAQETAERYPFVDPDAIRYGFLTREGGALMCREIAAGLADWLERSGATLRTGARVGAFDRAAGTVTLADGERLSGDHVVVTAGAWTTGLLPELAHDLTVYRTFVAYLTPPEDLAAAWRAAPAIVSIGGPSEGYALPDVRGAGMKIGASIVKRRADDPEANRTATREEAQPLLDAFAVPFARLDEYDIRELVTCAYTFTRDERFYSHVADRLLAVSACSGHAYKFGAAIGRRVAEAVGTKDWSALSAWLRAEHAG
ncbi:NAD(P)/FAD-dependent oxidoreductase [Jiella sp. M17.18]|uniref:NAD(P)/FAD-dependent oxidoreductase n=1 Tax=Jiella sp. M17.18 TaxID=3234247 RepID=UPI0034E028C4